MDTKFVLEQAAGATVIFALAGLAAWVLRGQSAASRYFVWCLATIAALVLPLASLLKPAGSPAVLIAPVVESTYSITVGPDDGLWGWGSAQTLLAAWAVGFLLTGIRLANGVWQASNRRRLSQASRIHAGSVEVRLSDRITVPETFGFRRPVILLPTEAAEWTAERLKVVLAHELVHVERHDWLTQLIAQFSLCVYWFHPLAWMAVAQIRKERELACDDGVLRQGYRNSEYAEHLVDIARAVRSQSDALAPSVPMATRSQLESRVRAILNPALKRGTVTTMMKFAATGCTALAILLFSSANGTAAGSATVSGTISDASGARVPQARVLLTPVGEGKAYAVMSTEAGNWELRSVAAGEYTLEVRRPGFAAYQHRIAVPEDRPVLFDVRLSVGRIEESMTVQGQGSPQASAAATRSAVPSRISIGGNVQAAKLLRQTRPEYPAHMKSAGITGLVVLQAVIGREGEVIKLESISPDVHPYLVEAATAAVKQWKYQPTLLNGVPVEVITIINVNFTLAP